MSDFDLRYFGWDVMIALKYPILPVFGWTGEMNHRVPVNSYDECVWFGMILFHGLQPSQGRLRRLRRLIFCFPWLFGDFTAFIFICIERISEVPAHFLPGVEPWLDRESRPKCGVSISNTGSVKGLLLATGSSTIPKMVTSLYKIEIHYMYVIPTWYLRSPFPSLLRCSYRCLETVYLQTCELPFAWSLALVGLPSWDLCP